MWGVLTNNVDNCVILQDLSLSLSLSDVNECQKRGVCLNGRCENLAGSYRCLCNEGFLPETDSKVCRGQWHTANKTKQHVG